MYSGIGVDKNPLGRDPLRAVTGHRVSVIEVPMGRCVEFDLMTVIAARGNVPSMCNRIDYGKVAVGDPEGFVGRRELNSVANREVMCHLPVDVDAG